MEKVDKIKKIQKKLKEMGVDGWLLFDNHHSNPFVYQLLEIPLTHIITRRFFYWIPQSGEPHKIIHRIEEQSVGALVGVKELYRSHQELKSILERVLKNSKRVLMEFSPHCAIPSISVVDGGTMECIRALGVEVESSADLLQCFTSQLDEEQMDLHRQAAAVLESTLVKAWDLIASKVIRDDPITEYEVQELILKECAQQGCLGEGSPICAVNEHSALPHYVATLQKTKSIKKGDFILIDLWCKKRHERGIYADITRVGIADCKPLPKEQEIFDIVSQAQQKTVAFLMQNGQNRQGWEVDKVCRDVIDKAGYADYFTHRTGHNIDTHVHGAGAHFDSLETWDTRRLLPGMCFSIEPGIYLTGEFGIRLETDILINLDGTAEVTGGIQTSITCLL